MYTINVGNTLLTSKMCGMLQGTVWTSSLYLDAWTDSKRIVPRIHLIGLFLLNLPQGS